MFFGRVLSFAVLASSALFACAKPVVIQRATNPADSVLPIIKDLESKVTNLATGLDGVVDPTGILVDIVAEVTLAVDAILGLDIQAEIEVDVKELVDLVSKTYTAVTFALGKYADATAEEVVNAIKTGEKAFAKAFGSLLSSIDKFVPNFVNQVVAAVDAINISLDIVIKLLVDLGILGLILL